MPNSLCNIHFPLGSLSVVTIRNGRFNNCIFHIPQTKGSTIGATVTPLFNRSKNSRIGKTVDILAVLATVFGIVPSVGIGAQQIAGGLSYLFPSIHNTLLTQLVLIAIFAVLYLTSAQTGLDRGIKYLSNLNFSLAGILLVSFLFFRANRIYYEIFHIYTRFLYWSFA